MMVCSAGMGERGKDALAFGLCALLSAPCTSHRTFLSIVGQSSECEHGKRDPKGDELLQNTAKPWETAVEAGLYTDVQFVCRSLV